MTLTRSSAPRTTSRTPWCSRIPVLLPAVCHRHGLPRDSFTGRASVAVRERVEVNLAEMVQSGHASYCLLFLLQQLPSLSVLIRSIMTAFLEERVFFKAGTGLSFPLAFAYECKDSDLQSQEHRRKSRFWPRPIPTQTLSLNILWVSGWSSLMQLKRLLALCFSLAFSYIFYAATKAPFSILNQVENHHLDSSVKDEISKISIST